eukprot:s3783_g10.t1
MNGAKSDATAIVKRKALDGLREEAEAFLGEKDASGLNSREPVLRSRIDQVSIDAAAAPGGSFQAAASRRQQKMQFAQAREPERWQTSHEVPRHCTQERARLLQQEEDKRKKEKEEKEKKFWAELLAAKRKPPAQVAADAASAPEFAAAPEVGVALGDMDLHFVWHAWHLATWNFTLCGRRGTYGTQLALVTRLVLAGAASFCVAGVALGDIDLHFAWQARRLWHSAGSGDALADGGRRLTLRGRGGAWRHGLPLRVAGVALGDMDLHFVWQAWHLATWNFTLCGRRPLMASAGSGDALGPGGRCFILRGRRTTWRHQPSLCVARVALGDMDLHFVWQAWHLATWTFTLCGRRGTYGTQLALMACLVLAGAASFCVAGVALGDIELYFAWSSLCVARVALGDMDLHFV